MNIASIPARHFKAEAPGRQINYIVMHDEEYPERVTSAEEVAHFFQTTTNSVSAHYTVDCDSVVQCVQDQNVAWHAPPNEHSIGIELSGYAKQTTTDWLDDYGQKMLDLAAHLVADLCTEYNIPPVQITTADLLAGKKGICGHRDVSAAWHLSTHTDPGDNFPWDFFMQKVAMYVAKPISIQEANKVMLNGEAVAIEFTPSGNGYYIAASDGGVFTLGDAVFKGSMGGQHLNAPVVDMSVHPDGSGYVLLGKDFGVFAYPSTLFKGRPE